MAYTVAAVITRAQVAIGDASSKRATTATLEGYVRDAVYLVKKVRPDLFLGKFATDYTTLASADAFPLDAIAFMPMAMFVGAMVESQDEESADRARGQMLSAIGAGALK